MKLLPFFNHKPDVDFVSPLPLEECQARLFGIIDRQHRLHFLSERPITHRVNNSDFYLARGMMLHLQGCRPPDLAESAMRPVLFCRLVVQSDYGSHVTGSFGFYSFRNILLLSLAILWPIASLCLAASLILGRSSTITTLGAGIVISLIAPLTLALIYLHEHTYLPYLTIYLRRVLLDPDLDPSLSQFTWAPYSRLAREVQIVLLLLTGSVIGTFVFFIFHRWQG